ncbi:magnesium and cobalt transport protein CorA [Streptomyces europaeiscabiei]|uniref:magnesium and cobalt transport protein CorA n=1 Tax=Streptomyces europaeiscabiei TaxID=146819 RepID=UPI002E19FBC7
MTDRTTPPHPSSVVDCALYEYGRRRPGLLPLDEAMDAARTTPGSFVWIGLHEPTEDQLQTVARAFALHPLAVEDALEAHQRPKLERYDNTFFVAMRTAVYVEHERLTPTSEVIATGEIMAFVGADFIVVVRHGPSQRLTGVRRRLEDQPELLAHGPTIVLHAITDTVVDQYLDVVDALETDAEEVETDAFTPDGTREIGRIYQLKRELGELRRTVLPLAQPLRDLAERRVPGVDKEVAQYFRDVHDHLAQAAERVTTQTELVDTALSLALTQTGLQQNQDVRRISAIAAMIAVPIAVFGVYGMNFDHMPELRWYFGYPMVLLTTVGVVALVYGTFRGKGWL